MRDTRCKREVVEEELNYKIQEVESDFKGINNFFEKYKEYTKEEMSKIETFHVINRTFNSIIESKLKIISYKYTLGFDLSELHKEYLELIEQIDNVESITSFFPFNIIALGILFEDGIESFEKLIALMDKREKHDLLFDYLINGCGLKREFNSDIFVDRDFKFSKELIELAQKDREQASKKLVHHVKTYWNEPIEDDYKGYWLWVYAAISKMFKLDDSKLKDYPYYPYELAHYKNEMEFTTEKMLDFPKETYKKGIPEYKRLEKIIPVKFHEVTNNLLVDFKTLSDEDFYDKYELIDRIDYDDYIEQKKRHELLGRVLIYLLIDNWYILEFDELDALEEVDHYKDFWGRRKVKPVCFCLDENCCYIAYIPKSSKIKSIFNIDIVDIKEIEGFDEYEEYFGQFDNE